MLDVRTKADHKLGTFCGGLSHRMLPRWMPSLRLGNLSYKCNGGTGDRFRERIHGEIPPTMRVREGDTVLMRFGEEVKSVKIRAVTNTTLFETDEGIVSPDSIEKWPWEFEQKGGDE